MTQEQVQDLVAKHLPGTILINPRRPCETAAQFLNWLAEQPRPAALSREEMRRQIWNFLDGNTVWKTSIHGPVRGGPRDHLILPFAPSARDVGKLAAALRQAF
jgi:hypothetical protein